MTQRLSDTELRQRVSDLLNTATAGQAVSRELGRNTRNWADRTAVAALRAQRAQYHYDAALAQGYVLHPASFTH